jgi:hypothetical protein
MNAIKVNFIITMWSVILQQINIVMNIYSPPIGIEMKEPFIFNSFLSLVFFT